MPEFIPKARFPEELAMKAIQARYGSPTNDQRLYEALSKIGVGFGERYQKKKEAKQASAEKLREEQAKEKSYRGRSPYELMFRAEWKFKEGVTPGPDGIVTMDMIEPPPEVKTGKGGSQLRANIEINKDLQRDIFGKTGKKILKLGDVDAYVATLKPDELAILTKTGGLLSGIFTPEETKVIAEKLLQKSAKESAELAKGEEERLREWDKEHGIKTKVKQQAVSPSIDPVKAEKITKATNDIKVFMAEKIKKGEYLSDTAVKAYLSTVGLTLEDFPDKFWNKQ